MNFTHNSTGAPLVRMAGRVAAILDVLSVEPVTVRRLAAEVGVPRSTAQRMLEALEANGRAERTSAGWVMPSDSVTFGLAGDTEHKDFSERPVVRDGFADRGVRWAP